MLSAARLTDRKMAEGVVVPDVGSSTLPTDELAVVFEAEYEGLVRIARLLGNPSDAEDVVQTAFVKVFRRGKLREPDKAAAYLRTTVVNVSRSRHRSEARALQRELAQPVAEFAQHPDVASRLALRAALIELPRRQREAVVLRYYCDLTEVQTAELLEISAGSVKAYTSRGLARLGELLREEQS